MRAGHGLHRVGDLRDDGAVGAHDPAARPRCSVAGLLLGAVAELIAPTRCAGCDMPGELLCPRCRATIARYDPSIACPRCAAPFGLLACTECWDRELAFHAAVAIGEIAGPLGRAVVLHKDAGELRLGPALGALLAERVVARAEAAGSRPAVVTWVPSTSTALGRRGFDHAHSLAVPVAGALGVRAVQLLDRAHARDQRRLGRAERLAAAGSSAFHARGCEGTVVLVDDVFTTGATLEAAADALMAAGAERVEAAVVARVW